jgi:hypothetical protein
MANGITAMAQRLGEKDLVLWSRLVQYHEAFALASMESLDGKVDRVAVIRQALQSPSKQTAVYLLRSLRQSELQELFDDLVFQASYSHGSIQAIRDAILSLPRDWVVLRIEDVVEPLILDGTDDEYRRILELYAALDPTLVRRLAQRAANRPDPDIREVGEDFLQVSKSE